MVGTVAGPNLTRGRGGLPADYTPEDHARALRRGVRRDGRSLMVMPSEVFTYLSQEDLGAIIAYLQQVPPVDREVPRSGFGPVDRALFAMGKLNIMVAGKTPRLTPPESVPRDDAVMPRVVYRGMTDAEIRALWLYLRSVPPKPFGNK